MGALRLSSCLPVTSLVIVASLLAIVAIPVALIWLLPLAADLASLAALATGRRRPAATPASTRGATPRLCFLVPAHDEALLIERCVRSLVEMERSGVDFDVHVIADNCTDETARIAAAAGARVLERHELTLRGKPQAILWAMAQLPTASYDAVVIIDADTVVDAGFARALAAHAPLRDKAVQAYFGLSNESDSWLSRLAGQQC